MARLGANTITGNTPNNGAWIDGNTLARDLTLTASEGPYIFDGITVSEGVTLTIEPGTVVKFWNNASVSVNGTLKAEGTTENPIVFTSVWDNDFGGDTDPNNYGVGYPADPGTHAYTGGTVYNWRGQISFGPTSTNSVIDHAIIRYGGYYGTMLNINSTSVTVSQSEISHSMHDGVDVSSTSPTITGNAITANAGYGMQLTSSNATITGNTISNNNYGIYVHGTSSSTITGNTIFSTQLLTITQDFYIRLNF